MARAEAAALRNFDLADVPFGSAAVLVGVAAAGNAYSASQAGYYNADSTVSTSRGTYQVHTTGYSPTVA
jgi:hypothetical protein